MRIPSVPKIILPDSVDRFLRFARPVAYLEMGLFLAICYEFNRLWFPALPAFYMVQPHPYLFGVALIGALYGLSEGLAVAGMTSVVWAVQLRVGMHAAWSDVYIDPVFWTNLTGFALAGLIGGGLRHLHLKRVESLEDRLRAIRSVLVNLQLRHDRLVKNHAQLQQRANEQEASVGAATQAPVLFTSLDRLSLHKELLEAVGRFVGAERCSVLVAVERGRRLRLVETWGWEATNQLVIDVSDVDVIGRAIEERRVVTFGEVRQDGQGGIGLPWGPVASLMCAPLFVRDELYGVLNIELLSFHDLSSSTASSLEVIMQLAQACLENIERFEKIVKEQTGDALTGLATYDEAVEKLHAECDRMHRYRTEMSAMMVRWSGGLDALQTGEASGRGAWPEIGSLLGRQMRSVDVVAHDEVPGQFLVLMPLTDLRHALVAAHRLHQSLVKQSKVVSEQEGDWAICVGSIRREETPEAFHRRLHREIEKTRTRGPIGVAG